MLIWITILIEKNAQGNMNITEEKLNKNSSYFSMNLKIICLNVNLIIKYDIRIYNIIILLFILLY